MKSGPPPPVRAKLTHRATVPVHRNRPKPTHPHSRSLVAAVPLPAGAFSARTAFPAAALFAGALFEVVAGGGVALFAVTLCLPLLQQRDHSCDDREREPEEQALGPRVGVGVRSAPVPDQHADRIQHDGRHRMPKPCHVHYGTQPVAPIGPVSSTSRGLRAAGGTSHALSLVSPAILQGRRDLRAWARAVEPAAVRASIPKGTPASIECPQGSCDHQCLTSVAPNHHTMPIHSTTSHDGNFLTQAP